jgi:monooxygenase
MYTYGYDFKSFSGNKIFRDGSEIVEYMKSAARDCGLDDNIMLGQSVTRVEWQSGYSQWIIRSENTLSSEELVVTSRFVVFCTGYYSYDSGFTPDFPNKDQFRGTIVHPQAWSPHLDFSNQEVVIIGSGATAVTLAPAMAKTAKHVTVLQRSPTYVVPMDSSSPTASFLYSLFPAQLAYTLVRCSFVLYQIVTGFLLSSLPGLAKKLVLSKTAKALGDAAATELQHFTPSYNPWEQRLCMCPDGDLFESIKKKTVSYVTDKIDTFTSTGIQLQSGRTISADVIVTATGFNLKPLGGIEIVIDGEVKTPSDCFTYKGVMLCGVPNMFWCMGYNGASLTLKVEPMAVYIIRVLEFMETNSYTSIEPLLPPFDARDGKRLFASTATYVKRNGHLFPRQGSRSPWKNIQNYFGDMWPLKLEPIRKSDKNLKFL